MSLFNIQRYWSETSSNVKDEKKEKKILKNLQKEAKNRESSVNSYSNNSKESDNKDYNHARDLSKSAEQRNTQEEISKQKNKKSSTKISTTEQNREPSSKLQIDNKLVLLPDHTHNVNKKTRNQESLPGWLASGIPLGKTLTDDVDGKGLEQIPNLNEHLINKLTSCGIKYFFPVQRQVIPVILRQNCEICNLFFRPNDICVSSPTGSGKTLAYVLPILHCIMEDVFDNNLGMGTRALVVLPVTSLAVQVYNVFSLYSENSRISVTLFTSEQLFRTEQDKIRERSGHIDIIIATPGRLVDHMEQSSDYLNFNHLQFLVIDEADRMMEDIKHEWLDILEEKIYVNRPSLHPSYPLTAASSLTPVIPLQKLLFSATLTQNLEQIQKLQLFQPQLFTCLSLQTIANDNKLDNESGLIKYQVPDKLKEQVTVCTAADKPNVILHLLLTLKLTPLLCFSSSRETCHRLFLLLQQIQDIEVKELTGKTKNQEKERILDSTKHGKIDILLTTDMLARGMDIEGIKCVISYEMPKHVRTYIHRVGRTARAGHEGTAITLLYQSQVKKFKNMLQGELGTKPAAKLRIRKHHLKRYKEMCEEALSKINSQIENSDG